jgi:NTP pyrophosphatase (non-canonical NTP hydrolase)
MGYEEDTLTYGSKFDKDHMTITELVAESYGNSKEHGFWEDASTVPDKYIISTKLALIHSEVSEALEELRELDNLTEPRYNEGKPEGFPSELADCVIRVADLCGYLGIDLEAVIVEKLAFNKGRPYRHNRNF